MIFRRLFFIFGACAVGLVFLGCGREEKAVELPPPVVTVTQAVEKYVKNWDDYTGRLAPTGTVEVRPQVSGYLMETKFQDGDMVKKGQPLFIIDSRPYQAEYNRAKGEYDKAESAFPAATLWRRPMLSAKRWRS